MSHEQLNLFNTQTVPPLAPATVPPAEHRHAATPIHKEVRGLRLSETAEPAPESVEGIALAVLSPDRSTRERQRFYDTLVDELKDRYKIAIRKWRKHMSGVAYELKYRDGRIKRLITAPRPRSPVSAAIFLHEVGHHAIGFRRYKPRCLEEFYVWQWAFREMHTRQIPVDPRVLRHYRRSMFHYVRLAKRRGIRELPHELHEFLHWPG